MPKRPLFLALNDPPFLADRTGLDASLWRFLVGIPGGAVAGILACLTMAAVILGVGIALVFGKVLDPVAVARFVALSQGKSIPADAMGATLALLGLLALLNSAAFVGFVAFAGALFRRKLHTYWTSAPRFRWRLLALGLGLFLLLLGPVLYLTRGVGDDAANGPIPVLAVSPVLAMRLLFALGVTVALLVAAAAEEVLFRGWFLRHLCALLRVPWIGVVVAALIFSAAHLDFNPDAFLERAAMGIGLGYAALRLGGVEFSLGIHAGNNILIVLFIEPLQLTPEGPHPWDWGVVPLLVVLILAYIGLTELVVRIKPLARWAGVKEVTPPRYFAFD